ncbi:NAD(P)-binding domain-containing protein [Kibdelosporangium philippinense]|uniref:NAD(P)-binding domain-containing protein n=1 Tax=Kibdelosporangium philippinense TaxID=211113 RepID=A0ABS8Z6K1_9PSEU|nr:NAD(P)-binding domain-containing protein [Kibdelosporangium philippinense]MCE7003518.1 NAD(P)-binding domain-containing protein [Kibdelosporangium philippinense]
MEPVTVIGLGLMGKALAEAFREAGHPTTAWNRTAGKAVYQVASVSEAVSASQLVIACLTTYEATMSALAPADLSGRTLITLNTGDPAGQCH